MGNRLHVTLEKAHTLVGTARRLSGSIDHQEDRRTDVIGPLTGRIGLVTVNTGHLTVNTGHLMVDTGLLTVDIGHLSVRAGTW